MYRIFSIIFCLTIVSCGAINDPTEDSDTVLVFKDTGAIQCESSGISAEESAQFLMDAGIDVTLSSCGFETNRAMLTVCGAGTGKINIHEIKESNLSDAEELEYFDVMILENEITGSGYQVIECETP